MGFAEQGDLKHFLVIFNNFEVIENLPKRYNQQFSKLNWEKIAWRYLLKSHKNIGIVKCSFVSN